MIILGTNSIKDTGFNVANSLRFNSGSSDYLNRTPSSASNRKTWTLSCWIKRGKLGSSNIFTVPVDGNNKSRLYFDSDQLSWIMEVGGTGGDGILTTNRVFRDVSAWYHLVFRFDTTNATAGDRMRLYVNGIEETSFATDTNPNLNYEGFINDNRQHNLGFDGGSAYADGYFAEVCLIDGSSLDATSFGEFDEDSGIWKPIDVSGLTFGTNGFYLDFEDSSALGNDAAGSNNFTVNNLTAIDQTTDTCTNNFATLNPLNVPTSNAPTFSEGNLQSISSSSASGSFGGSSSIGVSSGKWYIEAKALFSGHTQAAIGVTYNDAETARTNNDATDSYEYIYRANGNKIHDNSASSYGDTYTTNDIIGIAIDLDNHKIYWSKNGTFQNSGDPTTGATGTGSAFDLDTGQTYMFFHQDNTGASSNTSSFSFNFGSPAFSISSGNTDGNGYGNMEYEIPSGYYVLNSKNLAEYG